MAMKPNLYLFAKPCLPKPRRRQVRVYDPIAVSRLRGRSHFDVAEARSDHKNIPSAFCGSAVNQDRSFQINNAILRKRQENGIVPKCIKNLRMNNLTNPSVRPEPVKG
jgi:hypothetical protein